MVLFQKNIRVQRFNGHVLQNSIRKRISRVLYTYQQISASLDKVFDKNDSTGCLVFPGVTEGIDWGMFKEKVVSKYREKTGSFFFFHQKSFCFCFEKTVRLLKKRKKGSSALDLIITSSALSIEEQHTHLLLLPSSRISSTTTHTFFAENNEPFFVVHSLVARSVLPLVVN